MPVSVGADKRTITRIIALSIYRQQDAGAALDSIYCWTEDEGGEVIERSTARATRTVQLISHFSAHARLRARRSLFPPILSLPHPLPCVFFLLQLLR